MTLHYWQDRLITGALALMEACGLALLVVTVMPPSNWGALAARLALVAVGLVGTLLLARWLAESPLRWGYYDAVALGILAAMILLAQLVLWQAGDSLRFGSGDGGLFGIPPTILVAVAAFVLWWRGFGLAQKGLEFAEVSFNFRIGALLVLVFAALNSRASQDYVVALAAGFFAGGLVALAASRVEAKGRDAAAEQPLGPFEASLMATLSLTTVGAGLLVGLLLTGGGIRVLASVLRPIALALLEGLILIAGWMAALFQPIADWLQRLVENQQQEEPTPTPIPGPMEMPEPAEPSTLSQILGWLGTAILVAIAAVVIIEIIILLVMFLQKRQKRFRGRGSEYMAAAGGPDAEARDPLQGIIGQIRDWANLLLRYGLGPQLYTMLTVRTMYANLVRLATAKGFPRQPAATPYEYLPSLRRAFPATDADLERITNAYIGVHYGELPTGDDEMEQLRQAYARLQQAAAHPPQDTGRSRT